MQGDGERASKIHSDIQVLNKAAIADKEASFGRSGFILGSGIPFCKSRLSFSFAEWNWYRTIKIAPSNSKLRGEVTTEMEPVQGL